MGRKKKDAAKEGNIKGFDISINEFGEIVTSLPIERLNDFLNKQEKTDLKDELDASTNKSAKKDKKEDEE
jgi:hypothetical protein